MREGGSLRCRWSSLQGAEGEEEEEGKAPVLSQEEEAVEVEIDQAVMSRQRPATKTRRK